MPDITPQDILDFLKETQSPATKRELAGAFRLKGAGRIALKQALKELMESGQLQKTAARAYALPNEDNIPAVAVFEVTDITMDGEIFARPVGDPSLQNRLGRPIPINPKSSAKPSVIGDRILAKLSHDANGALNAVMMRQLGRQKTRLIVGRALRAKNGWMVEPVDKRDRDTYKLADAPDGLVDGHLVEVALEQEAGRGALRLQVAQLKEIIGHDDDPKAISLIAMFENGLDPHFSDAVIAETKDMTVPALGKREDLRDIPLVTIDGADARDFDDAVFAESDGKGGFHIIVAIADVAYYVREGAALAREAYKRGNSTYFPDRVVPMLPERLSNDLCSLRPREIRACMGFHLWIDEKGHLTRHKLFRGLMKSAARLTYEQVQAAFDGVTDQVTDGLVEPVLRPMHAAFSVLEEARRKRGALDIDMPERKILIDERGTMTGVALRERYDSHKLIEEFMILANVAAAEALEAKSAPCIYRVHDQPGSEKLDSARMFLEGFGLNLAKGNVPRPGVLNSLLDKVKGEDYAHLVNEVILRAQSQAVYSADNAGHYGLALPKYAHFTSPIRRYADLIVHRSLIRAYRLGDGGLDKGEEAGLDEIADHISKTERTSMEAERSAADRFTASYLESRIGAEFSGRISGVTRFGLFVRLLDNGADGLVPIRTLPDDFYVHDEAAHALIGRKSRRIFRLCAPVRVRVREADRLTGSTILELVDGHAGADIPGFIGPERAYTPSRKPGRGRKPFPGNKDRDKDRKFHKKKKTTTPKHRRKQKSRKERP